MAMKTISQRELRNENSAVIDAVERGETFRITRHGVEVAELGPVTRPVFRAMNQVLEEVQGIGHIDLRQMRAEEDEVFGRDDLES